jgi:hypothetical protein
MTSITRADLERCHLDFSAHLDASGWFGEVHRCIEHPRLRRITRFSRRGRVAKFEPVSWLVDGKPTADLDEAVARLNEPVALKPEEETALEKVTDEYVDLRKVLDFRVRMSLADKGVIEFRDGKCRRRKEGRPR